jgi:hypothetical protein
MAENNDQETQVTKSTQQLDLEARQAEDYVSPLAVAKTVGPEQSLLGEDGYVGTDPIYQNYANETEAPLAAEEGAEKVLEDRVFAEAEQAAQASEEREQAAQEAPQQEPQQEQPKVTLPPPTQSNS